MTSDSTNSPGYFLLINTISGLPDAAAKLLESFPDKRIFAFYGRMGAGKTTFIKQLCSLLQVSDEVTSPTFAIINVYNCLDGEEIYHFDFYRIKDVKEVMDIGYEEYFFSGKYCFIEWPEKIEDILPEDTLRIEIIVEDNEVRIFKTR